MGGTVPLHPTLLRVARILGKLGVRVFIIGARSLILHGIDIGRTTRDWDFTIDKPFTRELRDAITDALRAHGFKVQWRKWGMLVENDIHIDINYAPLIFDEEFLARSKPLADNIYLPSLEDIIVLKLMSSERKDIADLKKAIHQAWTRLDHKYLFRRARQAGLEKELRRLLRRLGISEEGAREGRASA